MLEVGYFVLHSFFLSKVSSFLRLVTPEEWGSSSKPPSIGPQLRGAYFQNSSFLECYPTLSWDFKVCVAVCQCSYT